MDGAAGALVWNSCVLAACMHLHFFWERERSLDSAHAGRSLSSSECVMDGMHTEFRTSIGVVSTHLREREEGKIEVRKR